MRRLLRILSCLAAVMGAATMVAAGTASAATRASSIAAHGLGARLPEGHVAPRILGVGALDVLPASVDLRQWAVTPGDQGQIGSCVTWAIDYGMLGWYSRFSGKAGQPFAPMYTYSQINGGADNGSYPTAALDLAVAQGNDTRADYTQGDYNWRTKPTAAEKANAANYKIKSYTTLFMGANQPGSATLVKQALATNHPVAIEMAVRHGFDVLGANPIAVDDDISTAVRGYHEVLALGYDAAGLIIENSWGTGWANGGFGRLSWRVVQHDVYEADTSDGFAVPPAPRTPPAASDLKLSITAKVRQGTSATVTYKVMWKGTAGSGDITGYNTWYQVDGKTFVRVLRTSPTSTTFTLVAHVGHPYRVAVRPLAGPDAGAVQYSAVFVPTFA